MHAVIWISKVGLLVRTDYWQQTGKVQHRQYHGLWLDTILSQFGPPCILIYTLPQIYLNVILISFSVFPVIVLQQIPHQTPRMQFSSFPFYLHVQPTLSSQSIGLNYTEPSFYASTFIQTEYINELASRTLDLPCISTPYTSTLHPPSTYPCLSTGRNNNANKKCKQGRNEVYAFTEKQSHTK